MKYITRFFCFSGFILALAACGNLEKEITLDLPPYESKLVVECYLEAGQPYTALLTKSAAYFDPFTFESAEEFLQILENDAEVVIRHKGEEIKLQNDLNINPTTAKIFNYYSTELVPADYENDFELEITTKDGRHVTATTRLLPKVPIDSVVVEFDAKNDTLARTLVYFQDDPNTTDYYRRMIHVGSVLNDPEFYFQTGDDFVDDGTVVFGSAFDYAVGDTVINTIFHIDHDYYLFLESIEGAVDANGNPFAQPGVILSNLEGDENALGIFTGFSFDRVVTIIQK